MNSRANITVSGRVQGVFFRYNAKKYAIINNLKGYSKNNPDGTVTIVVEGDKHKIDSFIGWCNQGPIAAHVDSVDVKWQEFKNEFTLFDVKY